MASFYHIFIIPKKGVSEEKVKKKMDLAVDWYKYSTHNWIVKSTSDIKKWQVRLKPFVVPGGSLLILKIDPSERQGWLAKSFWDWYKDTQ